MHFMRLSLRKGAHAVLSSAAWQETRGGMTKGRAAALGLFAGLQESKAAQEKVPCARQHFLSHRGLWQHPRDFNGPDHR